MVAVSLPIILRRQKFGELLEISSFPFFLPLSPFQLQGRERDSRQDLDRLDLRSYV